MLSIVQMSTVDISSHGVIPSVLDPLDAAITYDNSQAFPDNLLPSLHKPDRHLDQTITFHFQADKTRNSETDADGEEDHNRTERK